MIQTPPLINADEALGLHQEGRALFADATWYMPGTEGRNGRAEYAASHLQGAVFLDIDEISDRASPLPHMMPAAAQFEAQMGELGLSSDDRIVVYDSNRFFASARAWWMLRAMGHQSVQVVDGGKAALQAIGATFTDQPALRAQRVFHARPVWELVATMPEVRTALEEQSATLVDARPQARFDGTAPEPRPGLASGHMPGSVCLPYASLVEVDGRMASTQSLRAALDTSRHAIIATCGSGVSACVIALAYAKIGLTDVAVYDGSWAEWASMGGAIATTS
jgi:thiosulfate/3-mercaptopyruvate sulfurtransferase